MTNMIASYMFFVWDKEEDVNRQLTREEVSWYRNTATQFENACTDLFLHLPNVETTEKEVQALLYEIGKRYYGAEKSQLNFWFKCLYTVFFGTETGPRIGVFINLFGIENFLDKLERKLKNPYI